MQAIDYMVIILYVLGIVEAGISVFANKMKSSKDMFVAGGQSPWWVSGLSAFMTMFSAGTFVVWGGIAYKYGAVAILIAASLRCIRLAGGLVPRQRVEEGGRRLRCRVPSLQLRRIDRPVLYLVQGI